MNSHGLLLVAHGSKDPEWSTPFKAIEAAVKESFPGPAVLTYLESTAPRIDEGLAILVTHGVDRITVAPLFLAEGSHVRVDIPNLIRGFGARHSQITFSILPAIGHLPAVQALIASEVVHQLAAHAGSQRAFSTETKK